MERKKNQIQSRLKFDIDVINITSDGEEHKTYEELIKKRARRLTENKTVVHCRRTSKKRSIICCLRKEQEGLGTQG